MSHPIDRLAILILNKLPTQRTSVASSYTLIGNDHVVLNLDGELSNPKEVADLFNYLVFDVFYTQGIYNVTCQLDKAAPEHGGCTFTITINFRSAMLSTVIQSLTGKQDEKPQGHN